MAGPRHITDNLLDDNSNLLYKGLPIATTQEYTRATFVSIKGNDLTALQGRMDRPYRTIQAACNALWHDHYNPSVIMIIGGRWSENVVIPKNMTLHFINSDLDGGAGVAIDTQGNSAGGIVLDNSRIYNNSNLITVYTTGRIIGIGRAQIFNSGVGMAVRTGSNVVLDGLLISNGGGAETPALWAQDARVRNCAVSSINGNAAVLERINNAQWLIEDSSFFSQNLPGVRLARAGSYFRNCQIKSVNNVGITGGGAVFSFNKMENCQIFSDTSHALKHYGGSASNLFFNCVFKGALDCIFSDNYGHSHHAGTENVMSRFDNCEFYAGAGLIFNYTFDMYENVAAGVRVMITNSKMNKAYAFSNTDPRVNPAYRFRELNNLVIEGLPCVHEFMPPSTQL